MLLTISKLAEVIAVERMRGNTVAFVNGVFDLVHAGHVCLLAIAAQEADIVVVALDSDTRVTALKGPGRPVCPLADRAKVVAAVRHVHYVTGFATIAELDLIIDTIRPDVLVKGTEYFGRPIHGADRIPELAFAPQTHSSSELIQRLHQVVSPGA